MSEGDSIKLNYLLAPFSFLYGIGAGLRNRLFDWGLLPSEEYPVPVISVGNLSAGGTGKTPQIEYLIRLLKDKHKLAVLSRGYRRAGNGFLLAGDKSTSRTIGDEPYQMKLKFPGILVAVDGNRRRGIRHLLALPDGERPDVILLDDAFQHRYVKPSFSILTTGYQRPFYRDMLLPAGRLRESKRGLTRADVVIMTKCPGHLKPIERRIMEDQMNLLPHQYLFFTQVVYGSLQPVFPAGTDQPVRRAITPADEILLIAGIASSDLFIEEVTARCKRTTPLVFPDHHAFEKNDIKKIREIFNRMNSPNKYILMTEKDAARLRNNPAVPDEWRNDLFFLPITVDFCAQSDVSFNRMIENHIITFKKNIILS